WPSLAVGLAGVLWVALAFGAVALRTSGLPFIMITLALGQALWGLAHRWATVTGGDNGLSVSLRPEIPVVGRLDGTHGFYYFVLIAFVASFLLLGMILRSPFGLSWRGIRDREIRMQMLGYNTWLHKYAAYVVSALFGGLAGILNAALTGFVGPDSLALGNSATGILMVILGGPGTLVGPILGAGVIVAMRQVVSSMTERWMLVLGAVYIATVLFVPGGLMGLVKRPAGRLAHRAAGPSMPLDGKVASEAEVNAQHGFPQSPRLRRNS
ncbi:MAG TPA: branched-chain amino acid ABC transporter permease, partial [Myxococcaceae bacterium]|nr:branched-chain amino acid ABC transporter permease [Myxococcaceae bacterium]